MEEVEVNPRGPKTRATNKLTLNFRVASNPTLKDLIIILDEISLEPAQKQMVRKVETKITLPIKEKKNYEVQRTFQIRVIQAQQARSVRSKRRGDADTCKINLLVKDVNIVS